MQNKNKSFIIWITFLSLILIVHFSITIMYNAPANPISYNYNQVLQSYMNPIFKQNWRLFAPNPVSTDNKILVKGYYHDSRNVEKESEWIDVSNALITKLHNNRITPLRLAVAQATTSSVEVTNKYQKDQEEYKQLIEDASKGKGEYPLEMRFLLNISSEALYSKYKMNFDEVKIRIQINEFPDYFNYISGDNLKHNEYYIELPRLPYNQVEKL